MNISQLRHPKEKLYRILCLIVGSLIWLSLLPILVISSIPLLVLFVFCLWVVNKFFQASMYGSAVHVNESQHSKINNIIKEIAQQLNMTKVPDVFIFNAQGATNAIAAKFFSGKYILLFSDLVDLLWENSEKEEKLRFVIAHEMAHHAAGHTSFWLGLIMKPAMLVPYLGAAYKRSCELTSDRIAATLVANKESSLQALVTLASGSRELIVHTDIAAFAKQEQRIPSFFGFLLEILSTHPRMTRRVMAIEQFAIPNNNSESFVQLARQNTL